MTTPNVAGIPELFNSVAGAAVIRWAAVECVGSY
jgi:hypothetical protein